MARRFRSRGGSRQSQQRKTDWIGGVEVAFNESSLAAGASVIVSSFDTRLAGAQPHAPFTITRTIGYLNVAASVANAEQFSHGAFGICVVNGEAFDAGIASIISPFSESFDDRWFVFMYWSLMYTFSTGAGGASQGVFQQQNFDSRAQRKVENGDVIVAVMENGASTDGVDFLENHRLLVKLV